MRRGEISPDSLAEMPCPGGDAMREFIIVRITKGVSIAEDLFPRHGHGRLDVGQHRRLDEVAAEAFLGAAAGRHRGALAGGGREERHDLPVLRLVGERAHFRLVGPRVAEAV